MIKLQNELLSVAILPDFGGKISSIKSLRSSKEFLIQPEFSTNSDVKLTPEMDFLPPYAFGFDECFPTISESSVMIESDKVTYPDHGELWTSAFDHSISQDENNCTLWVSGSKFNYRFHKEISLIDDRMHIDYSLENLSSVVLKYLWSAHPLLSVDKGDEILLPDGIDKMVVNYSNIEQWIKGDEIEWPISYGNLELKYVQDKTTNLALKIFAKDLVNGKAGLYTPSSDETILFTFDTDSFDCLGRWLCYGGWPETSSSKDYTVAIEPTDCAFDALSEAIMNNQNKELAAGNKVSWAQDITIFQGRVTP